MVILSEISAGRSRGAWLVLPDFPLLPARRENCWQGSAGTGAAAPSVPALEGMEASAATRGAPSVPVLHHPGPFSTLTASPPWQSCRLEEERLLRRRTLATRGLYLGAGVPCNLGYSVRGYFSDKRTVAEVSWGCAPSLPARQLVGRSRSSGRCWRGIRAWLQHRLNGEASEAPAQSGKKSDSGFLVTSGPRAVPWEPG